MISKPKALFVDPTSIKRLLSVLTIAGLAASAAQAQWRSLFNGSDLSGWERVNGTAPYAVVDGEIVGTTTAGSPNSFLATTETFGDFVLELEFKQTGGPSNSGVQFRSVIKDDESKRVTGYQSEIDPSERSWTGGIYDERGRGWLYPVDLNPRAKSLYMPDRWNHLRIEAIGSSLRTWLNGIAVAHVIDDARSEGFIALQIHSINNPEEAGRQVHFRNIRIQTEDLKPAPVDMDLFIRNVIPNNLSAAEKAQGWRLLFNGTDTTGWRGAGGKPFPKSGWHVADGELVVEESGGGESRAAGDIVTEEEFDVFEVQFEFLPTPGANSGVKYFITERYDAAGGSAIGLEYQILDDERHPDGKLGVVGNRTMASLYDLFPSRRSIGGRNVPRNVGSWNFGRVVVMPCDTVQHWLNGYMVLEYERKSPSFLAMVERSKYADWEDFGMWESGHLLLQDHGNEVHFRSIKVRDLGGKE